MKRPPSFWWQQPGLISGALSPISSVYAALADRPFGKGISSDIPVLCIGNFVVGGAGKTPLAIALCELFKKQNHKVTFLTRGYGGKMQGPHLIKRDEDLAEDVGDEPLLLAEHTETVVAKDRKAGLAFITQSLSPSLIIMDDGFQSARIKPDHAMLVVDGARGLGNGCVLPAGPLRARLETQVAHADSLVIMQTGETREDIARLVAAFQNANKPVFPMSLVSRKGDFQGERVIGFCGIGHPPKFFQSLRSEEVEMVNEHAFPDHHMYGEGEAQALLDEAHSKQAVLVTTTKDAARLKGASGACKILSEQVKVLDVTVELGDEAALLNLL